MPPPLSAPLYLLAKLIPMVLVLPIGLSLILYPVSYSSLAQRLNWPGHSTGVRLFSWQFKLATWLRVYNYVKNKHVRAETVAYLEVVSNK